MRVRVSLPAPKIVKRYKPKVKSMFLFPFPFYLFTFYFIFCTVLGRAIKKHDYETRNSSSFTYDQIYLFMWKWSECSFNPERYRNQNRNLFKLSSILYWRTKNTQNLSCWQVLCKNEENWKFTKIVWISKLFFVKIIWLWKIFYIINLLFIDVIKDSWHKHKTNRDTK